MPQINHPSVALRQCHGTLGASIRGARANGGFVAATSGGLIPRHPHQAARKWRHRHQGKDGLSAPPPGVLGAEQGRVG